MKNFSIFVVLEFLFENEKVTYVSLLGLEEARRLAAQRTADAVAALSVFGDEAENLRILAQALLNRNH